MAWHKIVVTLVCWQWSYKNLVQMTDIIHHLFHYEDMHTDLCLMWVQIYTWKPQELLFTALFYPLF